MSYFPADAGSFAHAHNEVACHFHKPDPGVDIKLPAEWRRVCERMSFQLWVVIREVSEPPQKDPLHSSELERADRPRRIAEWTVTDAPQGSVHGTMRAAYQTSGK